MGIKRRLGALPLDPTRDNVPGPCPVEGCLESGVTLSLANALSRPSPGNPPRMGVWGNWPPRIQGNALAFP